MGRIMANHCDDCRRPFKANAGHCRGGRYGGCCKSFASGVDFDLHRTGDFGIPGDRRCLTSEEMLKIGWILEDEYFWRSPRSQKNRDRVRIQKARGTFNN